jgi:hypothetical protein
MIDHATMIDLNVDAVEQEVSTGALPGWHRVE